MSDVRDVIIIGGGPAGYTAALYAARANLKPLVIEGFNWGGQLMITSEVENYPGYRDGVMGPEMMAEFRAQAERFGTDFLTDDVTGVDFSERPFKVYVGRRRVPRADRDRGHRGDCPPARARVGARAARPRRHLLRNVRRCLLPRARGRRRRRRRLGHGGGALPDEIRVEGDDRPPAGRVPRFADHARPRPRSREDRDHDPVRRRGGARRGRGQADRRPPSQHRDGRGARVPDRRPLRRDRPRPDDEPLPRLARPRRERLPAHQGKTTETNVPGVFAAGDVQDHVYRQAITAAGSGCAAALDAERFLADLEGHPETALTAAREHTAPA